MSFSAHLLVDGIEGESEHAGYTNHIDVLNYSMSVSNPPNMAGGGFSAGKADASDFHFMLAQGKSSTKCEEFCATGKHVDTVTLKLSKTQGDETLQDFYTVTFTDCFISSHSESGSGDAPINSVSIAYSEKKVEYKEQKTKGGQLTLAASYTRNFKAQSA